MPLPTLDEMVRGRRVELHPGTDLWMMGARYGTVVGAVKGPDGQDLLRVQLDRIGQGRPRILAWGDIGRWLASPKGDAYGEVNVMGGW